MTGDPDLGPPAAAPPPHMVEKVLTVRAVLEGVRREVTVLVGDVVEFNHRGASGNGKATRLTEEALRLMAEAVHRYDGGLVDQGFDEGVMALFGAPVALYDHALGAVKAALGIKNTLNGYSAHLREERGVEVQPRLGLNTGQVVVRGMRDDQRMNYVPLGDTTELAVRLREQAEPGAILVTEATYRLVARWVASEPLVPLRVTGRAEPISAYRLTGRRRAGRSGEFVGLIRAAGAKRELGSLVGDAPGAGTCPRCRQANRSNARFCAGCGTELRALCPGCRAPIEPGTTFCDACGIRL
jgi:class 3 adenylate cyclase